MRDIPEKDRGTNIAITLLEKDGRQRTGPNKHCDSTTIMGSMCVGTFAVAECRVSGAYAGMCACRCVSEYDPVHNSTGRRTSCQVPPECEKKNIRQVLSCETDWLLSRAQGRG